MVRPWGKQPCMCIRVAPAVGPSEHQGCETEQIFASPGLFFGSAGWAGLLLAAAIPNTSADSQAPGRLAVKWSGWSVLLRSAASASLQSMHACQSSEA